MNRQHTTLNIYAKSPGIINQTKRAIEQLCEKECKEVVLNSEDDQATIKKLNRTEVNTFLFLNTIDDVSISAS